MPYKDPEMRRLVVRRYKQGLKIKLVEAHGGKCFDCKEELLMASGSIVLNENPRIKV